MAAVNTLLISGVVMYSKPEDRRSLTLTVAQWERLEQLAASTDSKATKGGSKAQGSAVGNPSWRALIRRIADGELVISEKVEK